MPVRVGNLLQSRVEHADVVRGSARPRRGRRRTDSAYQTPQPWAPTLENDGQFRDGAEICGNVRMGGQARTRVFCRAVPGGRPSGVAGFRVLRLRPRPNDGQMIKKGRILANIRPLTCSFAVGDTGIEPVTSSVSTTRIQDQYGLVRGHTVWQEHREEARGAVGCCTSLLCTRRPRLHEHRQGIIDAPRNSAVVACVSPTCRLSRPSVLARIQLLALCLSKRRLGPQ